MIETGASVKWLIDDQARAAGGIACIGCRHRIGVGFDGLSPAETDFMHQFKVAHDFAPAGSWIGGTTAEGPFLFTVYSGWVLRCRAEAGGRRRAAGHALTGDLIGLETVTDVASDLKVRALTDVTICRFDPARWRELIGVPSLGERIARLETIARIETEERLLAAGRSATANVAHFFTTLYDGLARRKLVRDDGFGLPLALSTVAECLNLTPVYLPRV